MNQNTYSVSNKKKKNYSTKYRKYFIKYTSLNSISYKIIAKCYNGNNLKKTKKYVNSYQNSLHNIINKNDKNDINIGKHELIKVKKKFWIQVKH